ncbi:MAG: AAA family ATPase [Pseudoxanthomonas sp.]|nr:AAA family ATPase [Pseudoxanthomonas sp.]
MAIYEEVLAWSGRLPLWRQDALRRLCVHGAWSDLDLEQLLDLAKQQHGIASELEPATEPTPFAADHFPAEATRGARVVLTSLHTLNNVGKIPSDQVLEFAAQGLTIAYGGNGTGKSGYARVLKQACRARSTGAVYPNAYDPQFHQLTPSATLTFLLDDVPHQANWSAQTGHVVHAALRAISVFDGDCARHYLQAREVAAFQPMALTQLQQLANGLNQALRPRLQAEINGLAVDVAPFNVVPVDTEAGHALHPVSARTDLEQVRRLATLSPEERQELARLPQEIAEADPTSRATVLDNAATRVDELAGSVEAANVVSDQALDAKHSAYMGLRDAEVAERAASALLQSEDPEQLLPGTGQGPWGLLFRAAREFSTGTAYPASTFPVTGDGAQCLLCQQELSPVAKERLHRFDRFVRDSASAAAQAARTTWQQIVGEVARASVSFTLSDAMSESLGRRVESLPADIRTFQEDLASRLEWLKGAVSGESWEGRPAFRVASPAPVIRRIANDLRAEALALRANLDAEALGAKRRRLRELQARSTLSEHMESIALVVRNLAHRAKLQNCLEDVGNTRPITTFAGQLARRHVSDALAARMNEELERLDLYHVRAEISSTGDAGSTRLGIVLSGSQLDPHLVLSEAEQRMCALAYFFAELHESGSTSGVVFDDPVSSLDHNHRTAVARRIVAESLVRQVIVFTHDAVFFGELTTLSQEAGVEPSVRSIVYRAEGPGYIDAGLPYDLRRHRERVARHRLDQQRIAAAFNNPPGDAERLATRNAYDDLRVTIEVGIEDTILNGTVVRFRDNISVGRLDGVKVVEASEFAEVQRLHDKCCRNVRAHSHAAGQQRAVTQPAELLQDINAVDALFSAIRRRIG